MDGHRIDQDRPFTGVEETTTGLIFPESVVTQLSPRTATMCDNKLLRNQLIVFLYVDLILCFDRSIR